MVRQCAFFLLMSVGSLLSLPVSAVCEIETPDFVVFENDGVIADKSTGLMWQRCPAGLSGPLCDQDKRMQNDLEGALKYIDDLNASGGFSGYSDWRLPNIKELVSLVQYDCHTPAINQVYTSGDKETVYFTSTFDDGLYYMSSTPAPTYYKSTSEDIVELLGVDFNEGTIERLSYVQSMSFMLVRDM